MSHRIIFSALLTLSLASAAFAAGSSSSSTRSTSSTDYDRAVAAVKAATYPRAVGLLEGVVRAEPRNADAWNYLGFSHRKLRQFDAAMTAYRKALAIDPRHRGANEYLGELYLDLGDVAKARVQLERLDKACTFGCEEYDDLKAAIARYAPS